MIEQFPNPDPEKQPIKAKLNEVIATVNQILVRLFIDDHKDMRKPERPKAAEGAMRNQTVDTRAPKWSNSSDTAEDTTPEGTVMPYTDNYVLVKRAHGWESVHKDIANADNSRKTDPRIPTDEAGGERPE